MQEPNPYYNKIFGIEEKKRVPWLFIAAIALLLVVIILLAVFLSSYLGIVHLSSPDDGMTLTDTSQDITYLLAPTCYEPVAYMEEPYAKFGDTEYFEVRDADPKQYLCTIEYGVFDLYYASTVKLPALSEFGAVYTRICNVGDIAVMIGRIEDKTKDIVEYFLTAETVDYALVTGESDTLYLKLMSKEYSFMYYNIMYIETEAGERYLYDRSTGRCVELGDRFSEELSAK